MRNKEIEIKLNPVQFNRIDKMIRKVLFAPRYNRSRGVGGSKK